MRETTSKIKTVPVASRVLPDGRLVELIYSNDRQATTLVVGAGEDIEIASTLDAEGDQQWVPVPATNNLIQHGVVVLPERPEFYKSVEALVSEIHEFIDRYLDLSPSFRAVAVHYILLTWVYDAFGELPYLRLRGDFGSGKTRALTVLGSLCNKGFFASGASTVSPIFYTLDLFRGTLILDEADFRFSDENAEIVKILNNGNVRGFPVLRQSMTPNREFNPRAFNVFGPKIIAMRHGFEDPALESRCITETMGHRPLRPDIPLNLPEQVFDEAKAIRNKLLMYRFQVLPTLRVDQTMIDAEQQARTNQILLPLLAVIPDSATREVVRQFVEGNQSELKVERSVSPEGMLLEVLLERLRNTPRTTVAVSEITLSLIESFGREFDRPLTPRYVGELLRKRLHIPTFKSHGVFVVPTSVRSQVEVLARRAGIDAED